MSLDLYPSFAKEGWLRHKENGPVPLSAQTGWLFQATDYPDWFGINRRELETTTPSAPSQRMLRSVFFRSRPPLLREGGECAFLNYHHANDAVIPSELQLQTKLNLSRIVGTGDLAKRWIVDRLNGRVEIRMIEGVEEL